MKAISEVCEKPQYGWTTKSELDGDGLKLLRITDIQDGRVDWSGVPHCVKEPGDPGKYILNPGDIVVARSGATVGKSYLIKNPDASVFASYLVRLRARDEISPSYLFWYLQTPSYWQQISDASSGIAQPNVNASKLGAVELPVPPIEEQRRIVEAIETHLSHLDAGVDSLERAKKSVRLMWIASLRGLLEKASEGAAKVRLDEVAEVRLGRQRSPKNHEGPHMRPYIRAANVTWDGLDLSDVKTMNWDPDSSTDYRMEPGDLVLAEGSGSADEVGKPAIWDGEIEECYFQNTLIRVRPHEGLTSHFLKHFFTHEAVTGSFARASRGVNIHHLGSKTLAGWPTPVPSKEVQDEFVVEVEQVLSGVEGAQRDVEIAERRADGLRRSILSAAFNGRLVA